MLGAEPCGERPAERGAERAREHGQRAASGQDLGEQFRGAFPLEQGGRQGGIGRIEQAAGEAGQGGDGQPEQAQRGERGAPATRCLPASARSGLASSTAPAAPGSVYAATATPTTRSRSAGGAIRIASHATPTALIPSPTADTAKAGSRRRSTGLAMTGETATRNSAASMTFPSWRGGC